MSNNLKLNTYGSLWNKWDLHVHTPASIENQYEQRIKAVINKYISVQVCIKDEEAKSMDKLVASILTMLHEWQEQKKHPQPQEQIHRHSFDIKLERPLYFDPFGQTGLLTLAII